MILSTLKTAKGLITLVSVLAVIGVSIFLVVRLNAVTSELDALRVENARVEAVLEAERAQHEAVVEALVSKAAKAEARAAASDAIKKEIYNAPESADGPVAPVLRDALGFLRDRNDATGLPQDTE